MLKLDNEHTLILPLVENKTDHVCLPLAINVILNYWGEYDFEQEANRDQKNTTTSKVPFLLRESKLLRTMDF